MVHVAAHEFDQFVVRSALEVRSFNVLHAQRPGSRYPMHSVDNVTGDPTNEDGGPVGPELHETLHLVLVDTPFAKYSTHGKVAHTEHHDVFPALHCHLTQVSPSAVKTNMRAQFPGAVLRRT